MRTKLITYFAVAAVMILIIGLLLWLLVSSNNGGGPGNNQVSNVPQYALSEQEQANLKSFVKIFAELYNTYSTEDYSNLYALGDYQTTDMQFQTKALIDLFDQQTPEGYDISSKAVDASFTYSFSNATTISASMLVNVTETKFGSTLTYPSIANLVISKTGASYFVESISYIKQ